MSKYTPGPWEEMPVHGESYGRRIFAGSQYIASVGDSDQKTPDKSNARLIASAPDLLEALEALADYFDAGDNECRPIENARAAIAKARGQR